MRQVCEAFETYFQQAQAVAEVAHYTSAATTVTFKQPLHKGA